MGSTIINCGPDVDMHTSLVHEMIDHPVVIGAWHGASEYYAAVNGPAGILAVVALVEYDPIAKTLTIKLVDEWKGPYYYNCPPEVLATLDPPPNKYAARWREKCMRQTFTLST